MFPLVKIDYRVLHVSYQFSLHVSKQSSMLVAVQLGHAEVVRASTVTLLQIACDVGLTELRLLHVGGVVALVMRYSYTCTIFQ